MQRAEFQASISEDGQISLPAQIRKRLLLKPSQVVKVIVETQDESEVSEADYSFQKVRKLLKPIEGEMSDEVLASRRDRS
jgi:bifunctional DNA-binding transcriptional regulator/antitoxin component of YhaV-PrlF toxin-antitoxin module